MRWLGWCVVLVVLVPAAWQAAAQQPERSSADALVSASTLEREARQIETMLIAPCCWREQVSVHQSEVAEQVKREIRTMLGSGKGRQEVLDAFVERYGIRILAEPPDQGFARILYHAPWIVGMTSVLGLVLFVRHVTRRRVADQELDGVSVHSAEPPPAAPGASIETADAYQRRLDDELRNLD